MNKKFEQIPLTMIDRVRRNHALEHATLNILAQQGIPALSGYSDTVGFWVVGEVPTEKLQEAINQAVTRLRAGEHDLAIHPYCGTNFLASGAAAGGAAWLALVGANNWRRKFDRLPWAIALATVALIVSQPLGPFLQKNVTTLAEIGELKCAEITFYPEAALPLHRVKTKG
ncbi:MAG TPA: DUF6391 domain-containing protein [Longilinea sp.]|nr:DUF6391 domain-containing protein [Longilinea sp.]